MNAVTDDAARNMFDAVVSALTDRYAAKLDGMGFGPVAFARAVAPRDPAEPVAALAPAVAETPAERRRRKDAGYKTAARARDREACEALAPRRLEVARAWVTAYAATMATGDRIEVTALYALAKADFAHLPAAEIPSSVVIGRVALEVIGRRMRPFKGRHCFVKTEPPTPAPDIAATSRQRETRPGSTPPPPAVYLPPTPVAQIASWLDAFAGSMVPGAYHDAAELAAEAAQCFAEATPPTRLSRNKFYQLADATMGSRCNARGTGNTAPYYCKTT